MNRGKQIYILVSSAGILVLSLLFFFNPENSPWELCFSRKIFHFYCAGCGATRATYALLHGNLSTAIHYNPVYTLILIPAFLYLWIALGFKIFRPNRSRLPIPGFQWCVALLALLILYSLLRNLPFEPFLGWKPD